MPHPYISHLYISIVGAKSIAPIRPPVVVHSTKRDAIRALRSEMTSHGSDSGYPIGWIESTEIPGLIVATVHKPKKAKADLAGMG